MTTQYAELHCHSWHSLLTASSSPNALVEQAAKLGLQALALTDCGSVSGAIQFWQAAKRVGLHAVIGAEVTLEDETNLVLLAESQTGYGNLCRLITESRRGNEVGGKGDGVRDAADDTVHRPSSIVPQTGKVHPRLAWQHLEQSHAGLIALTGGRRGVLAAPLLQRQEEYARQQAQRLLDFFGRERLFIELQHHHLPDDDWLTGQLLRLANELHLSIVASNHVHYATAEHSPLCDALTAIRHGMTLTEARKAEHLLRNSSYYLRSPAEMARLFRHLPIALHNTIAIANRCHVSLDFSHHRLPAFVPQREPEIKIANPQSAIHNPQSAIRNSRSPFATLYQLCHAALPNRYPTLRPEVLKQLAHELAIIEQAGLADYFLIVHDIVSFARSREIRCQGRGSAANSIVAYLLGITSIDPLAHNLLFERFLSEDRFTTPDIDIDFDSSAAFPGQPNNESTRREVVIQYVYQKYGHDHAAMVCNIVTYQARSAIRELGKVIELPQLVIERLLRSLDTNSCRAAAELIDKERGRAQSGEVVGQWDSETVESMDSREIAVFQHATRNTEHVTHHSPLHLLPTLLRHIDGCPRHLSIHSGGMLITGLPLHQIVPLEPATMAGRVVCQWDKDSVEDAGLIKLDLLGLRTLGLITYALHLIAQHEGITVDLDTIPLDDPELYRMLHWALTIGTFQVESRAQQQMLPRLKPTCFEDIIIQIAIVRPGPIQGGAVHPYLRRRAGQEAVTYLHPCLEPVLKETLGVLLFQEQAIRVAVAAAGFSPGEADMLRRALSRKNSVEAVQALEGRFLLGASKQGIDESTARAIFAQLAGFAGYGFPKSHSASFALIAYQTLWLKRYHPAAFFCALLNVQPMGFYSPEVIINDARRWGVETLPVHVNHSQSHYTLERTTNGSLALRMGLSTVKGVGEEGARRIEQARSRGCEGVRVGESAPTHTLTPSHSHTLPFTTLPDFCQRIRLPKETVANLIRAGALDGMAEQRQLLWQLGAIEYQVDDLTLPTRHSEAELPTLTPLEQTIWEYELVGLSTQGQVMRHYREALRQQQILSTWQVKEAQAGQRVRVAGMVVVRQRPATAKGILFMSLESESGLLDVVVKPEVYERYREIIRHEPLLIIEGIVQRSESAVSVLARKIATL